jgi:hypothetical protein
MGATRSPRSADVHLAALAIALLVAGFTWIGLRERAWIRAHPFSVIARALNRHPNREWCDDVAAKYRVYATAVVDRFGDEIRALWGERGNGNQPTFSLADLGAAKLRVSPKYPPATGFDSSSWSWDEAYGLIQRTQSEPDSKENLERWRDVDSMVRYLIEKDYGRLVLGKKYDAPEAVVHQFRPNAGVRRTGPREFTVTLDPGDFRGHEEALRRILEPEWCGGGYVVKVEWAAGRGYRVLAHHNSSRSFVNHRTRTLEIANLAWTKTVAHELGHVLGFDDHYYNVWNGRNCYYSQLSRLGDIMSNSEHGGVTSRHWELLDQAYPWRGEAKKEPFSYVYGVESNQSQNRNP